MVFMLLAILLFTCVLTYKVVQSRNMILNIKNKVESYEKEQIEKTKKAEA